MPEKIFDLCYHVGSGIEAAQYFIWLKEKLNNCGISVLAFSLNQEHANIWDKFDMKDYLILPEYSSDTPDIDWAISFVKNLGITNFRSLFETEKIFYDLSEEFCMKKMAGLVYSVSLLEDSAKAKYYLTYCGDEFNHNAFRLLSRMHKGIMIYFDACNMKGRMIITDNEDRYWKIPNRKLPEISENEIKCLKDYIAEYINKKTILWGDPETYDVKWDNKYIAKFFKRIKKSYNIRNELPQFTNRAIIKDFLQRAYNKYRAEKIYSDFNDIKNNEKGYLYFPLHYPKDSQLTLRGKPFLNQAAIVEIVSRYVPYPYTLLVKEHPQARGYFSFSELKKINLISNVKIIHPFTNSHDIIPNSIGIIAINSSVGYEGILYRKPVITLGNSFYRGQGVTIDVNSLYELESAFEKMTTFVLTESDVLNFLWKVKYFSYEALNVFDLSENGAWYMANALNNYIKENHLLE